MSETLEAARTALILFDFLEGHINQDEASRTRYAPVLLNVADLLAYARRLGVMIVYANADHRADRGTTARTHRDADNRLRPIMQGGGEAYKPVITSGTPGARVVSALAPRSEDYVVPKHRWSAFHGTYLETALRTRGIDTLILTGGSTDVGIAATAFAARDLDYNLVVVSDGCTSPEQDNHDQFLRRVFPRMARVRTTREIILMLGP